MFKTVSFESLFKSWVLISMKFRTIFISESPGSFYTTRVGSRIPGEISFPRWTVSWGTRIHNNWVEKVWKQVVRLEALICEATRTSWLINQASDLEFSAFEIVSISIQSNWIVWPVVGTPLPLGQRQQLNHTPTCKTFNWDFVYETGKA